MSTENFDKIIEQIEQLIVPLTQQILVFDHCLFYWKLITGILIGIALIHIGVFIMQILFWKRVKRVLNAYKEILE